MTASTIHIVLTPPVRPQTAPPTVVLAMANLGVMGLFIGMQLSGLLLQSVHLPDVPADIHDWSLIRLIAACQIFVPFLPVGTGGDFRQEIGRASCRERV